jgi:hypothetical protein
MASKFDVDQLRLQIEALLLDYPDLADDEILRADMLDGETDIKQVLNSLYLSNNEHKIAMDAIDKHVEVYKLQIDDVKARKGRFERRIEFLRELMLKILQAANLKKLELPIVTLVQTHRTKLIGEPDPDQLPDALCIVRREASRSKIKEALQAGQQVPGMTLSNATPSLMIKVR